MKLKTSPSGAPPFASRVVKGLVWLLSSSCARVPAQLAGESRNTVSRLSLHVAAEEKHRRAKDHNYQGDPDDAWHFAILPLKRILPGKTGFCILADARRG